MAYYADLGLYHTVLFCCGCWFGLENRRERVLLQTQNKAMQILSWLPQLSSDKLAAIRGVWRSKPACLAYHSFLLISERTLKPSIKFKTGKGCKEDNPKPCKTFFKKRLIALTFWLYILLIHGPKDFALYITFSSPPAPISPISLTKKKKRKMVVSTCILFVLFVHDIHRDHACRAPPVNLA